MHQPAATTFAHLLDWVESRLSESQRQRFTEQLSQSGESVQADLAWIRGFLMAGRVVTLRPLPHALHADLRQLFKAHSQTQHRPSPFRRFIATLLSDSQGNWALAGARGLPSAGDSVRAVDGQASQRQLVFTSEIADVVLNVQPHVKDGKVDVAGQVLPDGDASAADLTVQLLRGIAEIGITATDALGNFVFRDVAVGKYELVVSADRYEVQIAHLEMATHE